MYPDPTTLYETPASRPQIRTELEFINVRLKSNEVIASKTQLEE
jgi:hypothetical protein